MARPPSLLTLARRALRGEAALARGSTVVVATSGGPDSIALLHVMAKLEGELDVRVHAHGIDHGLRAEAARELDLAEELARSLGVPFARTAVTVTPGANLHARARRARYDALADAARAVDATAIATAHHADDRAETFLLRLLRGAGAGGLAVLPARAWLEHGRGVELVRPLIRARRTDVVAHVERHRLPFAEDPSNRDPRYLRSRVRAELVPLLEELGPGIVGHLEALADELVEVREGRGEPLALPRATQRALAALLRAETTQTRQTGSGKMAVWLPGGLVVSRAEDGREERVTTAEPRGEGSPTPPRGPMLPGAGQRRRSP